MPDLDRTPTPGRPSDSRVPGRTTVPEPRDPEESVDPPTVRSGTPARLVPGSGSKSGNRSDRANPEPARPDVLPLPVPGERIGDFGLEEAIGAGGMGAVFRAVDIKLDRPVAIKILPPDQAIDPDVVQRYYQEGRAAARLDHENIARVYSIGHDGRYHYIAFEYIEGTTIRQRVEAGGPLPVGDAINFTLQIANALVHSSSRGVVHRDIKPSNIIVTPQGRAKLVDMGLARRFERGEDTGLTQSGMTLGTFDYISPEQARDPRDVDVRGDLYSLGCTLFHMLSGRPPFPEGTVLQKLIQHQEEAPPDIRKLNPTVSDDLASILVKLMAKDRDRRYQSPEQLIRDLLTMAGSLGLRSINPEGLVWMSPGSPTTPSWTRHLVWAVPGMAFLLILGAMAWWGDGPIPNPSTTGEPVVVSLPTPPIKPDPSTVPKIKLPVVESPREYEVYSREDLVRAIAEAPPRSTILLADKGPYEIRPTKSRSLSGLDLTIRAEDGVRPVLRLARDLGGSTAPALIDLAGGRLTLDGLELVIEGDGPPSAIRAENAELIVRRCSFRRLASPDSGSRPAAISVKSIARAAPGNPTDRAGSLVVDSSEFDGGQVAVATIGPVEVRLRDCTFGPATAAQATIWTENAEPSAVPVDLAMSHVSVLAGDGPVFRFAGIAPRVRVTDSVFAPPTLDSPAPVLVAIDAPEKLDWRGVDNLYGRFGAYLQPLRGPSLRGTIRTFTAWADPEDPAPFRESGSVAIEGQPWQEGNPVEALTPGSGRSTRAFQLVLNRQSPPRPGARQGPGGSLPPPVFLGKSAADLATANATSPVVETVRPRNREVASVVTPPGSRVNPPPVAEPDDSMRLMPLTLPVPKSPRDLDADGPTGSSELTPMPMPVDPERPTPAANPGPVGPPKPVVSPAGDPTLIRSADEFREALTRSGTGSKILTIPADADWTLPAGRIKGMANWLIQAERGSSRPRIRFRPEILGTAPGESWSAWLTVQASSLRIEGIDLVISSTDVDALMAPASNRKRALFAIEPRTIDLTLTRCTVTIEGDSVGSAVVALLPGEVGGEGKLRIEDSLIRVGGDLVDVAGGRRLDLEVDNALVATGGSMIHAHGVAEGRQAEGLRVVLRQVTARMQGGLAHLQSSAIEPELPVTSINAREVVLATGDIEAPLLRVDGQGDLDALKNLIRWEGRAVAYHQIHIYRRDQSAQPGAVPTLYDRDFWNLRIGEREEAPIHDDLKFPNEWTANQRPWSLRRDDLRLPADSPAVGADLRDIPSPPTTR